MKKLAVVLGLAILHFGVAMAAFVLSFAAGMSRFDTGAPPTMSERALDAASAVLHFPFVLLAERLPARSLEGPVEYLPFVLDSLLWAVGLYLLGLACWKLASGRVAPAGR